MKNHVPETDIFDSPLNDLKAKVEESIKTNKKKKKGKKSKQALRQEAQQEARAAKEPRADGYAPPFPTPTSPSYS